jgi:hypothetical protein
MSSLKSRGSWTGTDEIAIIGRIANQYAVPRRDKAKSVYMPRRLIGGTRGEWFAIVGDWFNSAPRPLSFIIMAFLARRVILS